MHLAEQLFNLLKLSSSRPKNLRRTSVVVDYCDRKDLERHLLLNLTASFFISIGSNKFVDSVVVLIGILPPIWAQLADVANVVFLQAAWQRAQLLIDLQ
jgi:hypothetical protein